LSALNLLVISSKWEGLPVTLLEGMAARCPIVATAVGGVPNVVTDGESALLVPPEDSQSLASACFKILREAETARALVNAGFGRVQQQFSLDAMIQKTLNLYQELLEKHAAHTNP
jgi:glycosyltransferase involved in cell wall biosynthesis